MPDSPYVDILDIAAGKPTRPRKDPLDLIAEHESGNRNIHQNVVPAGGGYNPSVGRVTGPSSAQGPWQITNTTWRRYAPRVGAERYRNAMAAPREVQRQVAQAIFDNEGYAPWAPYNKSLRAALRRGEGGQDASPQDPYADILKAAKPQNPYPDVLKAAGLEDSGQTLPPTKELNRQVPTPQASPKKSKATSVPKTRFQPPAFGPAPDAATLEAIRAGVEDAERPRPQPRSFTGPRADLLRRFGLTKGIENVQKQREEQTRAEVEKEYQARRGPYGSPSPTGILHLIGNPVDSFAGLFRSDEENINRETQERLKQQQIAAEPEVEEIRKEYGQMSAPTRTVVAPVARGGAALLKTAGGIASAFGIAPNRLSEWANKRGEIIETASALPPLAEERNLSSLITGQTELKEVERGIPEKIATGVADLGVGLGQIILLKKATKLPFNQLLALEAAAKNSDKPVDQQLAAATEGYALGTALQSHLSRPVSAAIPGIPTAAQTGYEVSQGRMSPTDALIQTGIQTAQGAILTNPKPKEGYARKVEAQPDVTAQPEAIEPAQTPEVPRSTVAEPAGGVRQAEPQKFYHKDYGEVEVVADQAGARKGKFRVAEVANPEKQHYVWKSDLSGRGNQRMVPIKREPTNLESGLIDEADVYSSPEARAQRISETPTEREIYAAPETIQPAGAPPAKPFETPEPRLEVPSESTVTPETPAAKPLRLDKRASPEAQQRTPAEYSPAVQEAFKAWNERRAYIDNAGNYRVKAEGRSSGPIAPWNREVKRLFPSAAQLHQAAKKPIEQASVPDQSEMFRSSPEIEARVERVVREMIDTPKGRAAQFVEDEEGGLNLGKLRRVFRGEPKTPVPEDVAIAARQYGRLADKILDLNLRIGDAGGRVRPLPKSEVDRLWAEHAKTLKSAQTLEKYIRDQGYKVNMLGEAAKANEEFPAVLRHRPLIEKVKALFKDEEGSLDLDKLRERARQLLRENPEITDETLKLRLTEPSKFGPGTMKAGEPLRESPIEGIRKKRPGEGGFAAVSSPAKKVGPVLAEAQRAIQLEPPSVRSRVLRGAKLLPKKLQTALTSEFTPLRSLEKEVLGKSPQLDLARKFEQVAGASAKAEADFIDFKRDVVEPIRQETDDFNAYLFLKRVEDRLRKDPERKRVADWSIEKAQQGLRELEESVGAETMKRFDEVGRLYQNSMRAALRLQVESGRMSPELFNQIVEANDFYAPFKVLKYIEQNEVHGGGRRIATAQDLTKKITGIDSADFQVGNLLQTSAEQIMRSRILAEKNLKMQELGRLAELDTTQKLIRRVEPGSHPEPGFEHVKYFENGEPVTLEVSREVAQAIQGMNAAQSSLVGKAAMAVRSTFRWGATSANVGFQPVNLFFADLPRSALISRYGVRHARDLYKFPLDWSYSLFTSMKGNFGKPNELFMEWLRSGAANSTIQREITPEVFRPKPISPGKTHPVRRVLNSIAKFSNAIEETSKILTLKRGMEFENFKNLSPEQQREAIERIAAEVRNYGGSPDFLRRGSETRNLNLLFMFFNARLQGTAADVARLSGRTGRKDAAAAWARLGLAVGVPATVLAVVNHLPQYQDDYDRIPEWEKKNYFMIPRESYFTNEDTGERVRDYWRIPKRDIVQLFSNTIESAVDFGFKRDPRAATRWAGGMVEGLSPINIEGNDLKERGESIMGSLNPALKVPAEVLSNRDFFRKRNIVPQYMEKAEPAEQYRESTPRAYRVAGRALGVSPLRLEHATQGFTGGGLGQFSVRKPYEGRSQLSELPLFKRFFRSGSVAEDRGVSPAEQDQATNAVRRYRIRNEIVERIRAGEKVDLRAEMARGRITAADVSEIRESVSMSPRQKRFNDLPPLVALERYEQMSSVQRLEVSRILRKKLAAIRESKVITLEQKRALGPRIKALGLNSAP